jgi:hypothetical protein
MRRYYRTGRTDSCVENWSDLGVCLRVQSLRPTRYKRAKALLEKNTRDTAARERSRTLTEASKYDAAVATALALSNNSGNDGDDAGAGAGDGDVASGVDTTVKRALAEAPLALLTNNVWRYRTLPPGEWKLRELHTQAIEAAATAAAAAAAELTADQ